ncbi:MAG: NlpC/P60 family protein [Pseudomonadota bacterium]
MRKLDPRRFAFRGDLADENLRDAVDAPRYVAGVKQQVRSASLPLRRAPAPSAPLDTEVLHGETLSVFDERDGWAWVQLDHDSYVGYVPANGLGPVSAPATHRIAALRTYVFPEPDAKAPPQLMLSLNARVAVSDASQRFAPLASGGFVYGAHVAPLDEHAADFVSVAEGFIGAPYLWGGRTSVGLDCSGLVQLAAATAGFVLPRDADMQEAEAGSSVASDGDEGLKRGDLVFWEGHVGIMTSSDMFLHANAYHMAVEHEPLDEARKRIAEAGFPLTSIRRLPKKP